MTNIVLGVNFFTPATPRIDRLLTFVQILPCEIRVCVKKIKINESICKDSIVKRNEKRKTYLCIRVSQQTSTIAMMEFL